MKKLTVLQLLLLGLVAAYGPFLRCQSAQAVIADIDVTFEGGDYYWNYTTQDSSLNMRQIAEDISPGKTNIEVATFGTSTLTVKKSIENNTDSKWAGYKFTLTGDENVFLAGQAACYSFPDVEFDGNTIIFTGDEPLAPGESAFFRFDLRIANPEPATFVLFGLGGLILRATRRAIR